MQAGCVCVQRGGRTIGCGSVLAVLGLLLVLMVGFGHLVQAEQLGYDTLPDAPTPSITRSIGPFTQGPNTVTHQGTWSGCSYSSGDTLCTYSVTDLGSPAISHSVFGIANTCTGVDTSVESASPSNVSGPATDSFTGVYGYKIDASGSATMTIRYEGIYPILDNEVFLGIKAGTGGASALFPGPACDLAEVTVVKVLIPGSDSGQFNLSVTTSAGTESTPSPVGNGGSLANILVLQRYPITVKETGVGTDLDDYSTTLTSDCTNVNDSLDGSVERFGQFTTTEDAITCTFTNTRTAVATGTITVTKVASPNDGTAFTFNLGGAASDSLTINGSGIGSFTNLDPGNYTLSEVVPAGWDLNSVFCTTDLGSSATDANPSVISLGSGGSVNCAFSNEKQPDISVVKTATPDQVNEPGGLVTYSVTVLNLSLAESLTLTSLSDSVFGNITTTGHDGITSTTCALGQVIASLGSYVCSFTATVSGDAGDVHTNIVTATASDGEGNNPSASDDATVTVTDVAPSITVVKEASPTSVSEPGGSVTFSVQVTNNSVSSDPVTITSLSDSVHGNLDGQGTCAVPQTIPAGNSYSCSFTATVSGDAGDSETDVVTASGTDDDGNPVSDFDDATVTVTDVTPSITVDKSANPTSVSEPGGSVTFSVQVTNNSVSSDPVTITSLSDSIHGNLNGQGTCAVPQTIAAGDTYSCSFTATVSGDAGDSETDVVTASGTDDEGNPVSDTDDATVTVTNTPPTVAVSKTNDADGDTVYTDDESIDEPGGSVPFKVVVTNTSNEDVTIISLSDAGKGTCATGATLAPGASYTCTFSESVTGDAGDTFTKSVSVTVEDNDGATASASDDTLVRIVNVDPTATVDKTAAPTSINEPGGTVTFSVVVTNTSTVESLTLSALSDDIYGNIADNGNVNLVSTTCSVPQTIAANNGTYNCSFSALVSGNAGDSETDTVTATLSDNEGNTITPSDQATVTITDVTPSITVVKSASPISVSEPGGSVTYTVTVTNTSIEAVTLTSLSDNVFGNLNGQGSCATGGTIAANGGTYTCSFSQTVSGDAGDTHTNVVTAQAQDDEGNTASDTDDATVTVTDVTPSITVVKEANPTSVSEPGGSVTFSVQVTNNSVSSDPVTIDTLSDSIHGNLDGQGTCSVPQTIQPGDTYSCSFTATVSGDAGDSETDVVTASGTDDEGNPVSDSDDATVTVTNTPPTVAVSKTNDADGDTVYTDDESIDEPGGSVPFKVVVTNTSNEDVTIISLSDAGKGTCATGATLVPGASYTCTFSENVTGDAGDTVTKSVSVAVEDNDGATASASDDTTVRLSDVPSAIEVDKRVFPESVDEPGGTVTFSVTVENASQADAVTIEQLTDDIYGDITVSGHDGIVSTTCVVPQGLDVGDSYECAFVVSFTGDVGAETDTVTASGTDDDGEPLEASDTATLTVNDLLPSITVTKTADKNTVREAGEPVTITVVIVNNTAEDLTITDISDDTYDLSQTACAALLGQTLPGNGSLSCAFTVPGPEDSETDVVTVTAEDDEGNTTEASDDETVANVCAVDEFSPFIVIESPEDGATFTLNQLVLAVWTVSDTESAIESVTATADNGEPIDTSTPGTHSFTVAATDACGNAAELTHRYNVVFNVVQNDGNAADLPEPTLEVVINEVAWSGTRADAADEWIELKNNSDQAIDLTGWTLEIIDQKTQQRTVIDLEGIIDPQGFFLLERGDDLTISNIFADLLFEDGLPDFEGTIILRDADGRLVDTANRDAGNWPAGTTEAGVPELASMERNNPTASDVDDNWHDNTGLVHNGLDANGDPIMGTPREVNSTLAIYGSIVINEVAWSGTQANAEHEWIELKSNLDHNVDLSGWTLEVVSVEEGVEHREIIALSGSIEPEGFFLLEREDDRTIRDITADLVFLPRLPDVNGTLILRDETGELVDTANVDAGQPVLDPSERDPEFVSIERRNPSIEDVDRNWNANNRKLRNGHDAAGNPILGTPRSPNSVRVEELLRFQLKDHRGQIVANAKPTLSLVLVTVRGGVETYSTDPIEIPFQYDATVGEYYVELNTGDLASGTYDVWVDYGDGQKVRLVRIQID